MPSTEHGWPSVLARLSSPSAGGRLCGRRISIMSPSISILPSIGCDLSVAPRLKGACRIRGFTGASTRGVGE